MRFTVISKGLIVAAAFHAVVAWSGTDELSKAAEVVRKLIQAEFLGDPAARMEYVIYPAGTNLPDEALVFISGSPAVIVRDFQVGVPVRTDKGFRVAVNFSVVGKAAGVGPADRRIQRAKITKETVAYDVICSHDSSCMIQRPPLPRFGVEAMRKQLQDEYQGMESIALTPRFSSGQRQVMLGLKRQLAELEALNK